MLDLIEEMGYKYKEMRNLPKGNALVAIQWKDSNISGHYVVWDGKRKQFLLHLQN